MALLAPWFRHRKDGTTCIVFSDRLDVGVMMLTRDRVFSVYAIIKVRNSFCATEKVWWTSAPLLQTFLPSMPLPSDWALTVSNCRCEKSKIPLGLNMLLIF
jgi:hypothetical protein